MAELEKFRALGISEGVLDALRQKGFEEPSPIQELTIPLLLKGERDVIGQAQTGTGKTAAFGIPIIDTIRRGEIELKDAQMAIEHFWGGALRRAVIEGDVVLLQSGDKVPADIRSLNRSAFFKYKSACSESARRNAPPQKCSIAI